MNNFASSAFENDFKCYFANRYSYFVDSVVWKKPTFDPNRRYLMIELGSFITFFIYIV